MLNEFKEFISKGNVMDLAVGVIIGGAFGKIVSSLVNDVVMPIVGKLVGGVDFGQLYLNLGQQSFDTLEAAEKAGAPIVKYGAFINATIDFVIIAFVIFMAIKGMNSLKRKEDAPPAEAPADPEDIVLLREIRDALKQR